MNVPTNPEPVPYDASILASRLAHMSSERPGLLCKGIPPSFTGTFGQIETAGYRIGDARLPLPVATLSQSAMAQNRRWMTEYLRATGIHLAPHGKTSMSPALFRMQLEDGSWGLTAANAQQLAFFADIGVRRVILANQVVDHGNIAIMLDCAQRYPDLEFFILADSVENIDTLAAAHRAREAAAPLRVLVEMGVAGGRTGVRDTEAALALARHIAGSGELVLAGIEGYEGIVPGADQAARENAVSAMMATLLELARRCDAENLWGCDEILLTAGGTEFFDLCARGMVSFSGSRPHRVVIRSGCYITHDSIAFKRAFRRMYERSPDAAAVDVQRPEAALLVWAAIQSMPEPGLALATIGKRDISHDWELPVPLHWIRAGEVQIRQQMPAGCEVLRLNDQHAYLRVPEDSGLRVGDIVGFGVSHVCTTFDKWRCLFTVDDDLRVTGAIRTFF